MTINPRVLTNYNDKVLSFLKIAEGTKEYAHLCTSGKVTIGIGFNIEDNDNRNRVFTDFGITNTDLKNKLKDIIITHKYKPLYGDVKLNENQIREALNHVMRTQTYQAELRKQFEYNSLLEMENTCKTYMMPKYEEILTRKLIEMGLNGTYQSGSPERLALFSLMYQGPEKLFPKNGHSKLKTALMTNKRADFWYTIRYEYWGTDNAPGTKNRKLFESTTFGLFNAPDKVTLEEAENIFNLFKNSHHCCPKTECK